MPRTVVECDCPDCQNLNPQETEQFYRTIAEAILQDIDNITAEERERRQQEQELNRIIQPYNTRIDTYPIGIDKRGIYLGVELEVYCGDEDRRKVAKSILNLFNNKEILIKDDGSIDGRKGFEIVTRPIALNNHVELWNVFFDAITEGKVKNVYEHESCGTHIHVSKEPMGKKNIANIVMFVNTHINNKFIGTLADRPANRYSQVYEKDWEYVDQTNDDLERYEAVNIKPRSTVEFRIFSCSLNKNNILTRLEFCRALSEYAIRNLKLKDLSWRKFVLWLENGQKDYEYKLLRQFIQDNLCL